MRRPGIHRAAPATAMAAALLAGCASMAGVGTRSPDPAPQPAAPASSAPASIRSTPNPEPSASVSAGRPYDAATILGAMRESRRPGGVPDELETDATAEAVADALWTFDGSRWATLAIGGACGPTSCTLDVAGGRSDGGTDLYSFRVDPGDGRPQLVDSDLHGYPPELDAELDAVARDGVPAARLAGLSLVGARWLPQPDEGRFWLAYRSGGEEGSGGLDVLVDLAAGSVLEVRRID